MADYKVSDTNLTAIADAIRTKGGTSASLSFPDGFVTAIGNIPTGGGSTLITKSITTNGTYNALDDNADGYSQVSVSIQSNPANFIKGTFTPSSSEKGSAKEITIPYSGSGYPISCLIYPTTGTRKSGSTIGDLVQQYANVMFAIVKTNTSVAPDYADNVEKNQATAVCIYKSSSSDASAHSTGLSATARSYNSSGASTQHSNTARFKSSTVLSVYIANTSYGFVDGVEYTYEIVYSE